LSYRNKEAEDREAKPGICALGVEEYSPQRYVIFWHSQVSRFGDILNISQVDANMGYWQGTPCFQKE
jgi:hypothetical protein